MIDPRRFPPAAMLLGCLLLPAAEASAHVVETDATDQPWWTAWSWAPGPLTGMTLAGAVYAIGLARLWRSAGQGRGVSRAQAACFAGGIVVLFVALLSPIDTLSGQLAWVHMVQHTLLMLVAAPLLVAGSPGVVMLWGLPSRWTQPLSRLAVRWNVRHLSRYLLWQPLMLWLVFAVVLWVWHVPVLYDLALRDPLVHDVQHLAFLLSACLYWRVVVDPLARLRLTPPLAVAYLFTMSLQSMVLGVLMAFSPHLWYSQYASTTAAWGLTPLADQQVAGYIMWMPGCGIYALVAVTVLGLWLHRSIQHDHALEPRAGQ